MRKVKLSNKSVGDGETCFIIAEAGSNHDGKIEQAKELIDLAVEAECDAVKFQLFTAEKLFNQYFKYDSDQLIESLRKLEVPKDWLSVLSDYCSKKGIIFLSSVCDEEKADWLEEINAPVYKVPSYELVHTPLLRHIARKNKPFILSSGIAVQEEIEEAVKTINEEGNDQVILMHCVSAYPTEFRDLNLATIPHYKKKFEIPVGLSDHSLGSLSSCLGVVLDADIIEKHITLDRNLPGPDHHFSLEGDEVKEWVSQVRRTEEALGRIKEEPAPGERNETLWRRAIWAKQDIPAGASLTKEMLMIVRPSPESSLKPKRLYEILGKKTKVEIKKGDLITQDKLEL